MPDEKQKNKKSEGFIKKINYSGLSEFIKRPLPTEKEVEEFEEVVSRAAGSSQAYKNNVNHEEMEESLSEIYQDEAGNLANVGKLDIKKKRGLIFYFFSFILIVGILGSLGYGVYYYIFKGGSDATAIEFYIDANDRVAAGEEFFYTINYKNLSSVSLKNITIEASYPENFVFLDSSLPSQDKNSLWRPDDLLPGHSQEIKIKGKIINSLDSSNIITARIIYAPENFSSEFEKEAAHTTVIKGVGLGFDFAYNSTILLGEESEIKVSVSPREENYFSGFNLKIEPLENLEIMEIAGEEDAGGQEDKQRLKISKIKSDTWQFGNIAAPASDGSAAKVQEFSIKYKINNKLKEGDEIVLRFAKKAEDEKDYVFLEKRIKVEVIKSDLILTLIINGSREDMGVDFGQTLNYFIVYANKGDTGMKDVAIMAVLEGDFLDWTTLKDEHNGVKRGNSIIWSQVEIPELKELGVGGEGTIDFSINLVGFREIDLGKDFQTKSYAQFSIGNIEDFKDSEDSRSNVIDSKINSDLNLKEEVRYFSSDNIPVGTGPLPPKAGEETSFKVYWTLTNNLHELREARVEVILPDYVGWDDKNRTSVGSVQYDSQSRKVVWQIGRLPVTVYKAEAEFSIGITPTDSDKNKILVLLPGSIIQAIDAETGNNLYKKTQAKTTKLEDDEIAQISSDGRVE